MAEVDDSFRIGYCWDFQVIITHPDFTAGNLTASTFKAYLGSTLLATITAGGTGYTLSGTTVTLDYHVDYATISAVSASTYYKLFVKWEYSTHKKRFDISENEYVYAETE